MRSKASFAGSTELTFGILFSFAGALSCLLATSVAAVFEAPAAIAGFLYMTIGSIFLLTGAVKLVVAWLRAR